MRPWPVPTCRCGCGRGPATNDRYGSDDLADACYRHGLRCAQAAGERKPRTAPKNKPSNRLREAVKHAGAPTVARELGVRVTQVQWWWSNNYVPVHYLDGVRAIAERLGRAASKRAGGQAVVVYDDALPTAEDVAWRISEVAAFGVGES